MNEPLLTPLVKVQFGNLDTFCEELAARGPNVEPVVRICQQVRQGQSERHGPLPIEHLFGRVSFLRRTGHLLQVTVLHLYLGQRWVYPDETPDRAEVRRRIDDFYDRIRSVCETLDVALVDGSAYEPASTQP